MNTKKIWSAPIIQSVQIVSAQFGEKKLNADLTTGKSRFS